MGTTARRKYPDLIEDLLKHPAHYEFVQVVRLLEGEAYDHGQIGQGLEKWLRMRPASEISFPAADVRRCAINDKEQIDLQLNFMGLYGVDAPVPHYFTELIARDDDTSETMRAFLDIFSQRMYALFYLAWKKYRPFVDLDKPSSPYMDYVIALSGQTLSDNDDIELGFSGTMGTRVRNATTLAGMLTEFMNDTPVKVNEFVPRWVTIDNETCIGGEGHQAMILGDNTLVGNEVLDVSGKIDICVGPIRADEIHHLLPGKPDAIALGHLIERYLDPTINFDLVLLVEPSSILGMQLGSDDAMLGWSSWIGYQVTDTEELRIPGESLLMRNEAHKTEHMEKQKAQLAMVA